MNKRGYKEATVSELDDFQSISSAIMEWFESHWDIQVSPKQYEEFMEDYHEFKGIGEDKYDLSDDFNTFFDATSSKFSLPTACGLPNAAYSANEQGRSFFETMLGSVLGYGLLIGEERAVKGRVFGDFKKTLQGNALVLAIEKMDLEKKNKELEKEAILMKEEIKLLNQLLQ